MYNLASICFMCLTESKCLKTLYNNEQENDAAKQIRYILPEIRITDLKISVHICCGCHTAIQNFHSFKTRCLDNYYRLINYINTSQAQQANTIHAVIPPPQTVCVVPPPQPVCVVPPPQPVCVIPPPQPVCVVPPPQTICAVVPPKEKNIEKVQPAQDRDIDFIELEKEDPLLSFGRREDLNLLTEDMDIKEELFDSEESDEDDSFQPIQFIKCEVSDDQQDSSVSSASKNDLLPIDITMEDFECPTCKKKFSRHRDYKEHMKSYHADSETAEVNSLILLPEKSRKKYEAVYKSFMEWRSTKNVSSFCENVLLAYFNELAEKYKSSSLWAQYSMLRSTINTYQSVNIEKYTKLRAMLKRKGEGYLAKKAKLFTPFEIQRFMNDAPDNKYLATKVALIMGIMGTCHINELHSMNTEHIEDLGSAMIVTVLNTKTKMIRKFTITDQFYHVCKKYANLRPPNAPCSSFFLNLQNGKCTIQRIGINKFGGMGRQVATFLKLPNPENYTGHSFRKSSATLLAATGGDISSLKMVGGNPRW